MPAPHAVPEDDPRWRAVLARDRRSDDRFVFAVRSTGIYCRPSCPARRPRRVNVVFFTKPAEAERAGFRSCRRCKPREAGEAALVAAACRRIDAAPDGAEGLDALAAALAVPARRLRGAFRRQLGVTPREYAQARRVAGFRDRVRKGDAVTSALYESGYGSSSRLYEEAPRRLGMTPGAYRRGGSGLRIAYTTAEAPLGRVLVAATARGIAAVSLGASDAALAEALRDEYPRAVLSRDDARLAPALLSVLAVLSGQDPSADLPLDVQATAFQHRVWRELSRIPSGSTRTYAEVARRIGRPGAARAVARACAANRLAVLVPCHRVVPGAGGTGGYRWGAERKAALLAREAEAARAVRAGRARG